MSSVSKVAPKVVIAPTAATGDDTTKSKASDAKELGSVVGEKSDAKAGVQAAADAVGTSARTARRGAALLGAAIEGADTVPRRHDDRKRPNGPGLGTAPSATMSPLPYPTPPIAPTSPPIGPTNIPPMPRPDQSITPAQEAEIRGTLADHGIPANEVDRIIEQLSDGSPVVGFPGLGGVAGAPAGPGAAAGGVPSVPGGGAVAGPPVPSTPGAASILEQIDALVASLGLPSAAPARPR